MVAPIQLQTLKQARLTEVQQDIVDALEGTLKDARVGRFVALGICYVRPNGNFGSVIAESSDGARLLGASVLLQHRLVAATGEDIAPAPAEAEDALQGHAISSEGASEGTPSEDHE